MTIVTPTSLSKGDGHPYRDDTEEVMTEEDGNGRMYPGKIIVPTLF
jgi:hypothetical protein